MKCIDQNPKECDIYIFNIYFFAFLKHPQAVTEVEMFAFNCSLYSIGSEAANPPSPQKHNICIKQSWECREEQKVWNPMW